MTESLAQLQNAPWAPPEDTVVSYSLPEYWADKSKHGELLGAGILTRGANITTTFVLSHYAHHFPWDWIRSRFGVGERKGFWSLMGSQAVITLPVLLILLLGLVTFTFLIYVQCYKKEKTITKSSLKQHSQLGKWGVSMVFVGSCLIILPSTILFQQAIDPVVKYGVGTLANVSLIALDDLQLYREGIAADSKYFLNEYVTLNFKQLVNYEGSVNIIKGKISYTEYSRVINSSVGEIEVSAARLSKLRSGVYDVLDATSTLIEGVDEQVQLLDSRLIQLRDECRALGVTTCDPYMSVPVELPKIEGIRDALEEADRMLLAIKVDQLLDVIKECQRMLNDLLMLSPVGRAVSDVESKIRADGSQYEVQYSLDSYISTATDFIERGRISWLKARTAQSKHYKIVYLIFLSVTITGAGYSVILLFALLFAVLGTRQSRFPCYRRSHLATTSANVMFASNYLVIFLILPLTVYTILAIIGGTLGTVIVDSIKSRQIFDEVIDVTPAINHSFTVHDFTVNIPSYKILYEVCEDSNPGVLEALNISIPNITIPVEGLLPNKTEFQRYVVAALLTVSKRGFKQLKSDMTEFVNTDLLSNVSNQLVVANTNSSNLFSYSSTYYANLSQYYTAQSLTATNAGIRDSLVSLSHGYLNSSKSLTQLNVQHEEINTQLSIIHTDVSNMIGHFNLSREALLRILENMDRLSTELRDYAKSEELKQLVTDIYGRFILVSETFVERSLGVLSFNLGRCGPLANTYNILSGITYFAVTRYANIIWLTLLTLLVSLCTASIADVLIYKYFCFYTGIDYRPDEELVKRESAASSVGLNIVTDSAYKRAKDRLARITRTRQIQRSSANMLKPDPTPQSPRSTSPRQTLAPTRPSKHWSSSSNSGLPIYRTSSRNESMSGVNLGSGRARSLYNSDTDLRPDIQLVSLDDLSEIELSLRLSEVSTPLVYPSDHDLTKRKETSTIQMKTKPGRQSIKPSTSYSLDYRRGVDASFQDSWPVAKAKESTYYEMEDFLAGNPQDSYRSVTSPWDVGQLPTTLPTVSQHQKRTQTKGKANPKSVEHRNLMR